LETKPLALVIEDDVDQNLVFTTALNQAGYKTESITDGLVAQQRLTEVVPKTIVLDLHIPGVTGVNLLRQIRNDQRLAHASVILATADAALADSLHAEADLVLLKPISFSQLSVLASRFIQFG